jgi:signal peptidase I
MNREDSSSRRAASIDIAADILSAGGGLRVRARGLSMYPLIRHEDVIEVEPVDASAVKLGDVILRRDDDDRIVAHRVVKVHDQGQGCTLVTKGDWTHGPDALVEPGQFLGRVVAIERSGKRTTLNSGGQRLVQRLAAGMSVHSRWLYLPLRVCVRIVRSVRVKLRNVTDRVESSGHAQRQ